MGFNCPLGNAGAHSWRSRLGVTLRPNYLRLFLLERRVDLLNRFWRISLVNLSADFELLVGLAILPQAKIIDHGNCLRHCQIDLFGELLRTKAIEVQLIDPLNGHDGCVRSAFRHDLDWNALFFDSRKDNVGPELSVVIWTAATPLNISGHFFLASNS